MPQQTNIRFRITYSKHGFIRFTSILDIQKIWERTLRRSGVELAFSQGFHPQPKIQQAAPLPLGFSGDNEILDVWIHQHTRDAFTIENINNNLPEGLCMHHFEDIPLNSKSLQQYISSAVYELFFQADFSNEAVHTIVNELTAAKELKYTKHNGKTYDIRPLIIAVEILQTPKHRSFIQIELSARSGATARPDHLLRALNIDPAIVQINRKSVLFNGK